MSGAPPRATSVRAILLALAGGAGLYVVTLGAFALLQLAPAVANQHARERALAAEYDSLRARTASLRAAYRDVERLSQQAHLSATDRQRVGALRGAVAAVGAVSAGVQASLALSGISPEMRASLADAAGTESALAGTLLEALEDLELGDLAPARAWVDRAKEAREGLVDRLDVAQRLGLVDLRDRERALETEANRIALAATAWALLGAIIGVLVMLLVHGRLFRPLAALERGLAQVAQGDLQASVPVQRDDELGRLTAHFNAMTSVLRSRTELEALQRSEERFRAFIEQAPMAISVSRAGIGLYANPAFQRLFGLAGPGDVVGRRVVEFFAPQSRAESEERTAHRAAGAPVPVDFEAMGLRADGSQFPLQVAIETIQLGDGPANLAFVTDITVRRRSEEALRRSEAEHRDLIEHAPLGIYRSTRAGRFLTVNPALVRLLGYGSTEEVLRLDMARDVYADPAERERLIRDHPDHAEVEWRRRDGTRIVVQLSSRAVPGPRGEGECYEGLVQDVTEQRTLEAQVRQAQRLEAVGRLAGGVAHDFNNVLTAITGYSELLLADLDGGSPARRDVEAIRAAAQRAAALTRQLLAFSRKQVLRTRVLDLSTVVLALDGMLQRVLGANITLRLTVEPALGAVRADPGQIEQVILNLTVNARDAMPEGGMLTIETANADLDASVAREHADVAAGRYVLLAISDTGVGMDAETRAHLFEPFYTTKDAGKGTGLGLATVYGIVRQSGGHVWVYSEPGHGTTFKIYLPRVDERVESAPAPAPAPPAAGGSETLLLAEDDPGVREVAAETLTQKGYRVLRAADGQMALEVASAQEGEIHLLVTDIVMPGMTGRELAEALGALRPGLRVLYMSGYTDDAVVRHGVLENHMAYLQKPFAPDALARKVREVLDAER